MPLNIKNDEVERLVDELSAHTGESKTEAVRLAVLERLERARSHAFRRQRAADALTWLESEVWPLLAPEHRGRPLTRAEEDEILGYGPVGT